MDLREIENVNPWKHWYYLSKAAAVSSLICEGQTNIKEVVDVGAGSAFFSEYLSKFLPQTKFTCVDPNYEFQDLKHTEQIKMTRSINNSDGDLYLFMDVLEHVEDDKDLLESYLQIAKSGTRVLITVPAFMSLWSPHDVYLGHYRRYRRKEVEVLAASVGLKVQKSYYLFSSLLPIVYLLRKFGYRKRQGSNMTELPNILNWTLLKIHNFEHRFARNRFFGLSVVVLAVKSS